MIEYHDVLPVGTEKHATLFISEHEHFTVHRINGVWNSGWDFPTIYIWNEMTHPKDRAERRRRSKMARELRDRKYHQRIVTKDYKQKLREIEDDFEIEDNQN